MATRTPPASAPLTFDLPASLISKIDSCRRSYALKTASEVIRLAIEEYDFDGYKPATDPHRQISVRISGRQRATLRRFARAKRASVGELLRLALENLPARTNGKRTRK
ncbi:MAG: ribbon-helix-helix domain-containing protein [Opitutaceae bacterium]